MSRYALCRHGSHEELPIDREGFEVVLRRSDRLHKLTGMPLWYASDAADTGVLVVSQFLAYLCDDVPLLLRLLQETGFTQVRIDMASVYGPTTEERRGVEGPTMSIRPHKVDPWACALPQGPGAPTRPVLLAADVNSPFGRQMAALAMAADRLEGDVQVFQR